MIDIGVDFDEPIHPWYDYAHEASIAAGLTTADAEPPTEWAPHEHYGCSLDEWVAVLDAEALSETGGLYTRPAKPGAVRALQRLHWSGLYRIHIITARGSFGVNGDRIKALTRQQLAAEGIPYDTLTFAPKKGPVITSLDLDYFIDDRPEHFLEAVDLGVQAYLLNERWNQDTPTPEGHRVNSLEEFAEIIMSKHGSGVLAHVE